MRLKYHIAILILVCSLGGLALSYGLSRANDKFEDEKSEMSQDSLALRDLTRLEENLHQLLDVSGYIFASGETSLIDGAREHSQLLMQILKDLRTSRVTESLASEVLKLSQLIERNDIRLKAVHSLGHTEREQQLCEMLGLYDQDSLAMNASVEALKLWANDSARKWTSRLDIRRERLQILSLVSCIVYMLVVVLMWRLTAKTLIRPLSELTEAADHASRNEKSLEVKVQGPMEIRRLTTSIVRFADSLSQKIAELFRVKQRLKSEMNERNRVEEALKEGDARTTAILNATGGSVLTISEQGIVRAYNRSAEKLFGYRADEVVGRNVAMLGPNLTDQEHDKVLHDYLATGVSHVIELEREVTGRRRDGTEFPMMLRVAEMYCDDQRLFVGCVQDITERKDAEHTLRKSEERFRSIFEQSTDSVFLINFKDDRFIDVNPKACQMLGYSKDELMNLSPSSIHRQEMVEFGAFYQEVIENKYGRTEDLTCEAKSGLRIPAEISASISVDDDGGQYILALVRDITERKLVEQERDQMHAKLQEHASELEYHKAQLETEIAQRKTIQKRLKHDAYHDTLTNLPNRAYLKERIEQCIIRSKRDPEYRCGILFLDIDNFKMINDSLGHDAGDELLMNMAGRLSSCLRELDSVGRPDDEQAARIGGDEFVVLLDGINNAGDAAVVAERIQNKMARPFHLCSQEVTISVSIGIAVSETGPKGAEDLLRDADTAMYRAKLAGKARHAVFDEAMHAEVTARLLLENDIRHAMEAGEFEVHFQPIVSLESSRICSFEALLRWNHATRGSVSPAEFIPVAEEIGLIVPIGLWVLEQSLQQLLTWHAHLNSRDRITVSVNVSRRQLSEPNFVEDVQGLLQKYDIEGRYVNLEVTESMIVKDSATVVDVLTRLRAMGIEIAIDDFGTGQSSLSCLHEFPLDILKIDRSFVSTMGLNREYAAIVHAIIVLAQNLGMKVIAEGIETEEQLAKMLALDCDYGQGYLFARPMSAEAAITFLKEQTVLRKSA